MKASTYHRPKSIAAALDLMSCTQTKVVAGGTAINAGRIGHIENKQLVDISGLLDSRLITRTSQGWRIPMLTTWSDVLAARHLPQHMYGLKSAAERVGSPQIRNRGTVIGNLCEASAAADGTPNHLTLNTLVELQSSEETRTVTVVDFLKGEGRTTRRATELVTALIIPDPTHPTRSGFMRFALRKSFSQSLINAAAVLEFQPNSIVHSARIAIGGIGSQPFRLNKLEDSIRGLRIGTQIREQLMKFDFDLVKSDRKYPQMPREQNGVLKTLLTRLLTSL
ncbi:CO/xanthine dehydrogenase FAD-binding subunit [Methylobacterium sp. OAE515]|uniref:FAD binding domain-containing protein n=1 Tax=Methylobacterium sp. OAE515 TaxID=2817895 RepID=UPI00178A46D8